jgi:hypothetical protein
LPVYLSKLPEKEEGRGLGTEITLQDLPGMLADLPTLMPEACGNIKLGDIIGKWVRANLAG